jgi:hypothetical protein
MNSLSKLERHLEELVERTFARVLGADLSVEMIASQLARAMDDGVKWGDAEQAYAPDQYALTLHPDDADLLLSKSTDVQSTLANGLMEIARNHEYQMAREPHVTLAADPTLAKLQVRVISWHSTQPLEFTQSMANEPKSKPGRLPDGAFLILDAGRHYPLDRPVINIGRRIDNQIILEDPHVSRTHAQIRAREGKFVLFDLGSTSGTMVNGRSISQHMLQAGDVITIANERIVYGEDPSGPPGGTPAYTPPFPPRPAGDQRTRTSNWEHDSDE